MLGLDGAYIRGTTGDVAEVRFVSFCFVNCDISFMLGADFRQNFNRTFPQWRGLARNTNTVAPGLGRWKSGPAA